MKDRKFFWVLCIVLTLGLMLPQSALSAEKPLIIAFEGDAATLDPHGRNETTTTTFQRHVYESLVAFDKDLNLQPQLAGAERGAVAAGAGAKDDDVVGLGFVGHGGPRKNVIRTSRW